MMKATHSAQTNLLLCVWAMALVSNAVSAATTDWVYEAVEPEKTAGDQAAALDAQDYAHVVYGRDALYYDREDADGWHSEVADAASAPSSISMVLDGAGRPHVVYVDLLTHQVKYARRDQGGWSVVTIAEDPYISMGEGLAVVCLDAAGWPHVAYSAGSSQALGLTCVYRDASGWHTSIVGTWSGASVLRIAIGVADDGQPHVGCEVGAGSGPSYTMQLFHAWRDQWGWQSAQVLVRGFGPLQFDAAGRLHMAYCDDDDVGWEGVVYVVGTRETFLTEPLFQSVLTTCHLAVSRAGVPHVVFGFSYWKPGLQHWTKADGAWQQTMVHTNENLGAVMALDAGDRPYVMYDVRVKDGSEYTYLTKRAWQSADGWHIEEDPSQPKFNSRWGLLHLMLTKDNQLRIAHTRTVSYSGAPATGSLFYSQDETGWHERLLAWPNQDVTSIHLALDAEENPHIVYNGRLTETGFGYAWRDAAGWHTTSLEDAYKWGDYGQSGLALDPEGRPHIGYLQAGAEVDLNGGLRYAVLGDAGWESSVADSNRISELALALDGTGKPHFLVYEEALFLLVHVWQEDGAWHRETVTPIASPGESGPHVFPGIAVDQSGNLHICYHDYDPINALRYGHRTAQGWDLTTVDGSGGTVGIYCSLDLDDQTQPHIAYAVEDPEELRYARKDGTGWHISMVDSEPFTAYHSFGTANVSLSLAPDGTPHITYWNQRSGSGHDFFRYASLGANGWERIDLEKGQTVSSLVIDPQGRPHIAYCNWFGRENLAYLWPPTVLHRVSWAGIPSPQKADISFPVTLTARNPAGEVFTSFTNSVTLSGYGPGFSTTNLALGVGTGSWGYPLCTRYHDARTQVIYPASELGKACTINSLALEVTTPPGQALEHWTIRMKYTSLAEYPVSPEWEGSGWTVVYQGNEPAGSTGWRTFEFSTPFEYNGTDNLLVDFSFNNDSYSSEGQCRATETGTYWSLSYVTDSAYDDPLSWSGASPTPVRSQNVPNIRLVGTYADLLPVSLSPTVTTPFVNGVWTGEVTVQEAVTNLVLRADDGSGHGGESNPFDVQGAAQPPVIVTDDGQLGFSTGSFGFNVQGQAGQVVVFEVSTNLVEWLPLQTNTLGSGLFYFSDPDASNFTQRFYRAVTP